MSISQDARVQVVIADFANVDAGGKLNIVGGILGFLGVDPASGATAPHTVAVVVSVPQKYVNQQYALSVELWNETSQSTVALPNDASGQPQALRIQQMVTVNPLQLLPGMQDPGDAYVNYILVMGFANGLPLAPGTFDWRVQIDGQTRPYWKGRFHVPGGQPPPVFGGPTGPSSIAGISFPNPASDEPRTDER